MSRHPRKIQSSDTGETIGMRPTEPGDAAPGPVEKPSAEKNPDAVSLGRLGGKKGGPARAAKLTPEQRREIARKAAGVRWRSDEKDT
jgi:hypothetical protein